MMYLTKKKKKKLGENSTRKNRKMNICLKVGKLSTNLASHSVNPYIEEATRYFKA